MGFCYLLHFESKLHNSRLLCPICKARLPKASTDAV